MLHLHTTPTPLKDAAAALNDLLRNAKSAEGTLLLLSGGSALSLVEHLDTSLLGPWVTLTMLDERWTYNEADSNFAQLTALPLWHDALTAGVSYIDPRPQRPEDLTDTAKRFDLALKHWHIRHRTGSVIATMGIGADGHTAGILPLPSDPATFETLFLHTHTCVRGYRRHGAEHPARMTVTLTYLQRHVSSAIVYAIGEGKRKALDRLQSENGTLAETPARILRNMRLAKLYTDCPTGHDSTT